MGGANEDNLDGANASKERVSQLNFRVVKTKTEVYDIITRSFGRKSQWNELPHGLDLRNNWNLMWVWSKLQRDMSRMLVWQKANHFIGAKNVSRKDFLKRNIERAMKFSARAKNCFDIMPLTYILPKEYVAFLETFSDLEDKEGKMNFWIMKPAASSRGRGISLVNDIAQVTYGEAMVMQRYIKNPLLLNGYKFDLRIYVLVTSYEPMKVYVFQEGLARFASETYTQKINKNNKFMHLTNYSINKKNERFIQNENQEQDDFGYKWSLGAFCKHLEQVGIDMNLLWSRIYDVVIKTLLCGENYV